MAVRIGVGLDDWPFGERDPSLLCDYVDAAEGLGIDSIWLTDRVTGPSFNMEAIVALSFIAARTSRMKFGTSVLALPVRHPTILAKELATLDYLSGGRSLPAVGIGSDDRHVYEACGVSRSERAGRTDEMIEIMRLLWSEDNVSFSGRYYTLSGVTVEPKPIQKDLPPIWIGGRTEPAMRRVARLGDGWLVSQATPDEVLLGIDRINQLAAEYGRTIDDDHFGVLFSFCLAGSRRRPRRWPPRTSRGIVRMLIPKTLPPWDHPGPRRSHRQVRGGRGDQVRRAAGLSARADDRAARDTGPRGSPGVSPGRRARDRLAERRTECTRSTWKIRTRWCSAWRITGASRGR